jgi:hypothetical protein
VNDSSVTTVLSTPQTEDQASFPGVLRSLSAIITL